MWRYVARLICWLKHGFTHPWMMPAWVLRGESYTMRCPKCHYSYTKRLPETAKYSGVPERRRVS